MIGTFVCTANQDQDCVWIVTRAKFICHLCANFTICTTNLVINHWASSFLALTMPENDFGDVIECNTYLPNGLLLN